MKILDLPFRERDVLELLNLDEERDAPDYNYAGYGWARVDEVWLDDTPVRDALLLAIHSPDDSPPVTGDIELEFELPEQPSVGAMTSTFLDKWLPTLPRASALVLVLCNPHRAELQRPNAAAGPLYYAHGDVESWLDHHDAGDRIRLASEHGWVKRDA
ncbi:MAG TPA: hypothetical protein VIV11_32370 [Kofleriaceae bacterium]